MGRKESNQTNKQTIHLKSNIASKKMKKQSSMLNNLGSYVNGSM